MLRTCKKCDRTFRLVLGQNRWVKWVAGTCPNCGHREKITNLDFLQPSDPEFALVYGHDPFKESDTRVKQLKKQKTVHKEGLDRKYWQQYRGIGGSRKKPWDEKDIRKEVLDGGGIVDEALNRRKKNG